MRMSLRFGVLAGVALFAVGATPAASRVLATIDLAQPFATRAPWRFTATQAAEIDDPVGLPPDKAPGSIRLCLSADDGRTCQPDLLHALGASARDDLYADAHFLRSAGVVRLRDGTPLLLVSAASLHGGNGDQRVATMAFAYDRARDSFAAVYGKVTGRNNSQEVRFIAGGPLKGAIVSAEPTSDAPFAFWITVNRFAPADGFRQILRYRSATRYGDGNPLAVIDSEMPAIQRQLGLSTPGAKVPLPAGKCPDPRIVRGELWC